MSDPIDRAQAEVERHQAESLRIARAKCADLPTGTPGECDFCGEWSQRLINGACAPCRDRYHLDQTPTIGG